MATRAELVTIIEDAAARHGVPVDALLAIAHIESKLNAGASNPTSSASGLFQFVDSTAREYGLTGDKRNDASAQADAAARMMAANTRSLRSVLGREPSAGELYLAHQQGLGGARALLRNPGRPALEVLTEVYGSEAKARKALTGNGGNTEMTASQFANKWVSRGNATVGRIPPASVGGNAVGTQLDVKRQAPTPATPSGVVTAIRNRQNMTPGADLSAQSRELVTPFLTKSGQGVTDPAGIVFGGEMTTRLPQTPGQSIIERTPVSVPPPVRPGQSQIERTGPVTVAPRAPAPAPVTASDRVRGNTPASPPAPVSASDMVRGNSAPKPSAGVVRVAGLAGSAPLPAGVRPAIPSTDTTPSAPARLPNIPGPNARPKDQTRLTTVGALDFKPGTTSPLTQDVEVENPAYAALMKRVQQGEIELRGLTPSGMPLSRDGRARYEASKAALEARLAQERKQLENMQRTVTVQRTTRAPQPVAAPVRATAPQSLYHTNPIAFGMASVSQSGDTSVGNQLEAAQARASGEGGRIRRY